MSAADELQRPERAIEVWARNPDHPSLPQASDETTLPNLSAVAAAVGWLAGDPSADGGLDPAATIGAPEPDPLP